MNDLLRAASAGSMNDKKGYFINIAGIADGIVELTDDEVTLVERILNPDNWATKKYLSDKQVDIINFESPIKQSMLADAVEFFNRRDGLDSSEFDYIVHEEDRDDRIINKIFEKMRFQGLTGVSYDKMYRTLKFIPKECCEKILQTSIILKDMCLDDVVRFWEAMGYIPNKPYIVVDKNRNAFLQIRIGEYMHHSDGLWGFGYDMADMVVRGDTKHTGMEIITCFNGQRTDKNLGQRLSCNIGLYLNWLAFATRWSMSKSISVNLLYNNPKAMMISWSKYLKLTSKVDSIANKPVEDIVDEVYKLSCSEEYKVNFYEVHNAGRWDDKTRAIIKKCEEYLKQTYPVVW